jgi:hypothetical protein
MNATGLPETVVQVLGQQADVLVFLALSFISFTIVQWPNEQLATPNAPQRD